MQTPIYPWHVAKNAKMIDFFGFTMPIQYESIVKEHHQVRTKLGAFDVSHMGEFFVTGKDAVAFLNYVSSQDVSKMADGQVLYGALLNDQGGIVDDCTIYRLAAENYLLIVNAANIEKDFSHLKRYQVSFQVDLKNASADYGLIALQGPESPLALQTLFSEDLSKLLYYRFTSARSHLGEVLVARLGYTGEDGFEILVPAGKTLDFWQLLFASAQKFGLEPIGLGARDTLRLEVAYPLYGQDLSDRTSPLEANLGWVLKLDKQDFLGKAQLLEQKKNGLAKKLVAFTYDEGGVPRKDYPIFDAEGQTKIGQVTSGTLSPSLQKGIGLGYLEAPYWSSVSKIAVEQRQKMYPASLVKPPFVKPEKPHYPTTK